ncbi:MAG: PrsW family intramembrane metalloprotease [Clostridia bacterium]|nr:PrsW family intramembrane metalloprotease [Clostridia bacterium]
MKVKQHIKKFFYESFRVRSKDDYAKLFTRGTGECEGENCVYPWFWLRVLCVLGIAYTLYAVINATLPGAGDWEVFYFVGASFLDIAFIVLLYELYPKNDISLLTLLCVMVIGGTAADFISAFIYYFHGFEVLINGWYLAVIAGVGEEIAKAIPAILCVILLKKKSPSAGFLIGAAVGTWFSITENASYIHGGHMNMMVLTATARAFGCMFSHAVWTALITRAFCKYGLKSYKFYLVVIINMALHFCIDMPLESYLILLFTEAAVCGLCAFIWSAVVIYRERRAVLPPPEKAEIAFSAVHKSRITSSAFLIAMCAVLLVFSALYSNTYYVVTRYTFDEFLNFAHSGYTIEIDKEREFDAEEEIYYFASYQEGKLTVAYQKVEDGDISYIYCYYLRNVFDENGEQVTTEVDGEQVPVEEMQLARVDIIITIDDEEQKYYPTTFMNGEEAFTFYEINPELNEGRPRFGNNEVQFIVGHDGWDLKTVISFSACAAVALAWGVTYIILKRKK